jgi:hypothetical protein
MKLALILAAGAMTLELKVGWVDPGQAGCATRHAC